MYQQINLTTIDYLVNVLRNIDGRTNKLSRLLTFILNE